MKPNAKNANPSGGVIINLTKIDAARRQIEAAISLWFSDADPVAVHTLIAAGHHVCHDLLKHRGAGSKFLFNMDFIRPEMQQKYKKMICEAENFFKHSDKETDPATEIEFRPGMTEFYILDAIQLFHALTSKQTHLMMAFYFRFLHLNPSLLPGDLPQLESELLSAEVRDVPKSVFLDAFLERLTQTA